MPRNRKSAMIPQMLEASIRAGFSKAYAQVQVDPVRYLQQVRRAHRLPVQSWGDMLRLDEETLHPVAASAIKAAMRIAALEGTGLGFGGLLTIVPDMGILSAITIRMLQKLSLIYGFEYTTEEEVAALWIAAASAAGLDLGREFVEKQAIERLVPRIIDRIAVKVGTEVAEKWAGRLIPILSAGFGGTLNYYFVRSWGRRAQRHFIERHRSARTIEITRGGGRAMVLDPHVGLLKS
ncbi:MAG: EcsC family protein [Candidatus Acidiferrales bacterium]